MERTTTRTISALPDSSPVLLGGFVQDLRLLGKVSFIVLRDSTGTAQLVIKPDEKEAFDTAAGLTQESVVLAEGIVKKSTIAKAGAEVLVKKLTMLSKAAPLPIAVMEKGVTTDLSKRLDFRPIDLRKRENQAAFRIQAALLAGMQEFLNSQGFIQVFTPCLMGTASESGSEVFAVAYYNTEAFLRQDPQLHRQLTIAGGFDKIYDVGPCWRAEVSHTTKHLCEHRVCAAEMSFINNEQDVMRLEEGVIIAALQKVKALCEEELKLLGREIIIPTAPFPELRFPEIYDILTSHGKMLKFPQDLDAEAEKILWQHVQEKYKTEFYWFNKFPFAIKPFYVMEDDDTPGFARSVDLNYKGLELSSGGQREHRYERIIQNLKTKGVREESVEWFSKFFKYGVPPHGGFAIGIERLTREIAGLENIKEAVLFPRDPERLMP